MSSFLSDVPSIANADLRKLASASGRLFLIGGRDSRSGDLECELTSLDVGKSIGIKKDGVLYVSRRSVLDDRSLT